MLKQKRKHNGNKFGTKRAYLVNGCSCVKYPRTFFCQNLVAQG